MTTDDTFDVLIAGGGLVGASLAVALRDSGRSVAVIEPVPAKADGQPSFDERHTALAPTSRRFFTHLGLWPAIEAGAEPIRRIHVSDRGHGGFTRLTAEAEGLPALGHVAPNRVLGQALRPAMAAAATVHCPARIIDTYPQYAGDGSDQPARLVGRRVRIADDQGEHTLTTRLLVVADGMRSATREALGIDTRERDYGQSAIIANVRAERAHNGMAYERFTPEGPLAVLPAADGAVSVVWPLPTETAEWMAFDTSDATLLARLQSTFGWRLGRLEAVGSRALYPLTAVTATDFAADRAVVLGNAAHALHPVGGQGLNLALRDVAALVEALREAPDPGDADVLSAYARSREGDYRRTYAFTDGLVRLFTNDWPPLAAIRNIGLTALDLFPPARRLLLKQGTGAAGDVPPLCQD
ncbi:2-octaprenyl-6-methoxyphenyl hydroxylase [Spiribacter roseus]|uniref:2-octaprenyl-6-methoxyphenyl hydroxylase n=1 Tax=Spiribacter roseus TaxID=1855875 RepID=UPI00132FDB27|nr:2-octaprenyl-6-methoxyphenyl hydroxylase [Spiribacter roseus]KAF0281946.1 2-octaprenyl-6-methoxyphenyl hydroxylase [Spiribacter roseus]